MGRRKSFFDKQNSVTYSLIHAAAPAGEQPERIWIEKARGVGVGRPDPDAALNNEQAEGISTITPAHPLSFLQDEPSADLTDQQRKEIVDLGLPDDGYDYLKHLRDPSSSAAPTTSIQDTTSLLEGSAIFVPSQQIAPPEEDFKEFQSYHLQLRQAAQDEAEAAQALPGVSAFTRETTNTWSKVQAELDAMREVLANVENMEGDAESEDEILDDFLLTAAEDAPDHKAKREPQVDNAARLPHHMQQQASVANDAWEDALSDTDSNSASVTEHEPIGAAKKRSAPGSIASTYWRPERSDRNTHLSAVDERFEQLALGYNSDEFGELDSEEEDDSAGPRGRDVNDYSAVLDQFLAKHATHDHAHEGGQVYSLPNKHGDGMTEEEHEAAIAIAKAKEVVRAAQEKADAPAGRPIGLWEDEVPREQWDCESVLTSLSNLDNHPGKISEPRSNRSRQPQQHPRIQLSAKTNLPVKASAPGRGQAEPGPASHAQSAPQPHRRDLTAEQKRTRKAAAKEERRIARANKKELKILYRDEAQRHNRAGVSVTTISMQ